MVEVALEVGPRRRVFAQALGWIGWCRAGRDEERALAALLAAAPRYVALVARAGLAAPADEPPSPSTSGSGLSAICPRRTPRLEPMPRAPRVTGDQVVRALSRAGWTVSRHRGSHAILVGPGRLVTVPVHAGRTLKPKTLASILQQAGLTIEEFLGLL